MKPAVNSVLTTAITLAFAPVPRAFAAEDYTAGATYQAGSDVCYLGDLYRTKWWAGPNDLPTDVDSVVEPWDTPWERIQFTAPECGGGEGANRPPTVQVTATPAAADPSGQLPVELVADADDPDGDLLSYTWVQLPSEAPSVTIEDADRPVARVMLPEATLELVYRFEVTVSDGQASVKAPLGVSVAPDANRPPSAMAETDLAEVTGAATVQLSAMASSDPDGDLLTFQWVQLSPASPLAVFDDAESVQPRVTLPQPTVDTGFVFQVRVSDGQASATAEVTVNQLGEGGEQASCAPWDAGTIYLEGDLVAHDGEGWRAHWWTRGEVPGTTGQWGVWRPAPSSARCDGDDDSDPGSDPTDAGIVRLSDLLATEAGLTSGPLMERVRASIATRDNVQVEAITPGNPDNPANVQRVEGIVAATDWDFLFPRRAPEYTYQSFLRAVGKFPAFCGDYDDGRDGDAICRKALATMFAHFTQETGGHTIAWPEPEWRQGLVYLRELGWSEDMANGYGLCDPNTWQGSTYPCGRFEAGHPNAGQYKSYFGRGAKQLSYNYNYGPFSKAMFGDVQRLLEQPNLVADSWLNLASAVFFYVYPQPPKPSMLHALDGTWVPNQHDIDGGLVPGFGVTTHIINGGIECGGSTEHVQSQNRIDYYLHFADYLGVPVAQDEVLGCANMQRFDTLGAGALAIYWEQDWSQPNACQLVNYQTAFSALGEGDYVRCVEHHFDIEIDYDN